MKHSASQAREQQKQLSSALNSEHVMVQVASPFALPLLPAMSCHHQGLQLNDELQAALKQCEARSAGGSGADSGAGAGSGPGVSGLGAGGQVGGPRAGSSEPGSSSNAQGGGVGAADERGKGKGKAMAVEEEESAVGSSGHIPDSTSSYGFTPSEVDADFARLATR